MNKKSIILVSVLAVIAVILVTIALIMANQEKKVTNNTNNDKTESITASIYTLVNNPTTYQKETFMELKTLIESNDYDDKQLAQLLAKNFLLEFYDLSRVNSKDVRGLQFINTELQDRFKEFGWNIYNYYQYYKNIKDLEIVDATITNTKTIKYNYSDDLGVVESRKNLPGYEVTIDWSYKDNEVNSTTITIVKWDENYTIIKVQN